MSNSSKNELRKWAQNTLQRQPLEKISATIFDFVQNWPVFKEAQNILFYWPFATEINVLPLLKLALDNQKNCFLPKALPENQIAYNCIYSLNLTNLQKGIYKNWESSEKPEFDFEKLDLIFVPALAFDKQGYRLGRGKGFYDKLLSMTAKAQTVGLIPKAVLLETLNCLDEWDISVNYIVSEAGIQGHRILKQKKSK